MDAVRANFAAEERETRSTVVVCGCAEAPRAARAGIEPPDFARPLRPQLRFSLLAEGSGRLGAAGRPSDLVVCLPLWGLWHL
ncbi:Taf5-Like Rna polymerase Ii P300/Cbp-Associated Factor-Associated Factor 65 Kda Subunit 5L [Manis pentadactyla]|nr:Taf5-Like Rna polymerase Ii P300/Cbp-Associated Factor-Associated Factor 65 Kda Subunit 5L [Manis pentadactyla]